MVVYPILRVVFHKYSHFSFIWSMVMAWLHVSRVSHYFAYNSHDENMALLKKLISVKPNELCYDTLRKIAWEVANMIYLA